ncbi:Cocaine esterase [Hyphodiscus hymeniophilus]|uniref:Cocaine esterase n=1 Tax=Hyphodiscus hymeniophilus TaxID=353542 RepID=A0A9P6VFH8_9HELO|nr:Cocaine esterase [Hyphodiscus hymeniophilus]
MSSIAGIDIIFSEANHDFSKRWHEFGSLTEVLPKGWTKAPGRRALQHDLIFEKDLAITLRDGSKIWADTFRPPLDRVPFRAGIPRHWTSDLEKFEGPDPAEWCPRGYAIINVDPRGVFDSDGDIMMLGTQEGRDGYDVVEYIASQSWCNGAVAFAGNSWLAAAQWYIAAEKPPHLKAIAPWEGFSDSYREIMCRGGIPNPAFSEYRSSGYCGRNRLENAGAMARKYPLVNGYWEDKHAKLKQISIPIYCLASYSTGLHTEGSIRGFLFSSSTEKWLRIHHTQEWHDLYQPWANDDLQKFFDKYLRELDNGWETTPRVRHSILGYNCASVVNRAETTYPPPNMEHIQFFLDCENSTLRPHEPSQSASSVAYLSDSWDADGAHFVHKFELYTELVGFSKAKLYMSCTDTDDMDVYVIVRKLDKDDRALLHINIPMESLPEGTTEDDIPQLNIFKYSGPNGRLRASHRGIEQDPELSMEEASILAPADVWHPHKSEDKITPGQIVCLDIPLWPSGIIFQAGESIRLEIKGHEVTLPEFPALDRVPENLNRGHHVIYSGPDNPSSIVLPLAAAKGGS